MARSSRHKSSKHSSREARVDYSDSERKSKEDIGSSSVRHLKHSEKQMLESKPVEIVKDSNEFTNLEFNDDHGGLSSSSRKRKDKVDNDRWTGGDVNDYESLKSDSRRSSRKDEKLGLGIDGEDEKRGGGGSRAESKHHSSRSERRERGQKEKERNGGSERKSSSGGKSEKYVEIVMVDSDYNDSDGKKKQGNVRDERGGKHGVDNSDSKMQDDLQNSEPDRDLDRRVRRKRDTSGDGDKHQNGLQESDDRRLSLRDDKSGRLEDGHHTGEKCRDKYREDADRDHSNQDEKQRDIWPSRDATSAKSDDKQVRNENKCVDVPQKKSKLHHNEYDRDRERDRERDRDREHDREKDRDRERDHERYRDRERDHERDHDRERDRVRDHDRERDRVRDHDRERDHDRDRVRGRDHDRNRVRDHDHDRGHREHDKDLDYRVNELDRDQDGDHNRDVGRSHARNRGRDRYRHDRDRDRARDHIHERRHDHEFDNEHDYVSHVDDKVARYKEERGRSPDGYDEYHGQKEKSVSRKPHVESVTSNSQHKNSPSSRAYVNSDKYRDGIQVEMKYGDPLRDGTITADVDKVPKYQSGEKRAKFEDNHTAELPERSPSTKPSPSPLKERSPSTTSVERRYRSGSRRSLDVDECERRSSGSNDTRDVPTIDRHPKDFSTKKPLTEDYPPSDSLSYHKSSQGNAPSYGPSGLLGDENRGRYRRNSDPSIGRGRNNAWKGVPNWSSQLPNGGFMPFPPGPPALHHGGFPPMMSQFPPPFNVRPFPMVDADQFPSHVRPPIGWPNMLDGSVPPHFHNWDGNNGIVKEDPSMFSQVSSRGRDMNHESWKPNGDVNTDVTSGSQKDGHMVKPSNDEASSAHGGSKLQHENSCVDDYGMSVKKNTSSGLSSAKDIVATPSKVASERTPESVSIVDAMIYPRSYLAKLDVSMDLSDPELYNQCIEIRATDQPEYFVEDLDLEDDSVEDKSIEPEVIILNRGLTYFPAAKDSIFQRAMNLYKNLSTERTNPTSKGTVLINPPADESLPCDMQIHTDENAKQTDPTSVLSQQVQIDTNENAKQTDPTSVLSQVQKDTDENAKQTDSTSVLHQVQTTGIQEEKDDPEPATSLLDIMDDGETLAVNTLVASGGIIKEKICTESILKVAVVDDADADVETTAGSVDGKNGVDEYLDVKVSNEVVMCLESVNVFEMAMLPVSNESEVILSRIHHAPESTH